MTETTDQIVRHLRSLENKHNQEGMGRFGINVDHALGISVKVLRQLAKEYGRDHETALELWETGIHEARLLAVLTDDPGMLSEQQMECWVRDIDSWDLCDQACSNLFDKWPGAVDKVFEWSARPEEFVKRAGFVLMVALSVHDKKAADETFTGFLPVIERESGDGRNFVKKAVNWALRAIGKRNDRLNKQAIALASRLSASDDKTARWIGRDALRELQSEKVQGRFQ